jgi:hypothetical protein
MDEDAVNPDPWGLARGVRAARRLVHATLQAECAEAIAVDDAPAAVQAWPARER